MVGPPSCTHKRDSIKKAGLGLVSKRDSVHVGKVPPGAPTPDGANSA